MTARLSQVTCIVLDVDDTLYLERDYVRSGFAAVGTWLGTTRNVQGFAALAWAAFERGARGDIFDRTLLALGLDPDPALIGELVEQYRGHKPVIELSADARLCLNALAGKVQMAVITDGPLASQQGKVDALGLRGWADPVICTAMLGEGLGKPHPRAFEMVEQALGKVPTGCMYVGDNPNKDFIAPFARQWVPSRSTDGW